MFVLLRLSAARVALCGRPLSFSLSLFSQEVQWYGHFWLPTALKGDVPSPRAGHTSCTVKLGGNITTNTALHGMQNASLITDNTESILIFGGYDGESYFDDMYAVNPTRQLDAEIEDQRWELLQSIKRFEGRPAPEFDEDSGLENPYPDGWILEPDHSDLDK